MLCLNKTSRLRILGLFLAVLLLRNTAAFGQNAACVIDTVAGGSTAARGDGGPALEAELLFPADVQVGPDGLVYIADNGHDRIRRVTADGRLETIAGTGEDGVTGDGVPARQASISFVRSMAFGSDGALYFLDSGPSLRRIDADGIITTIAGGRATDFSGDGGPAINAGLQGASRIAVGPDNSVYVVSSQINSIRRITPGGLIETIAGTGDPDQPFGSPLGDGGLAVDAVLNHPSDIAVDSTNTVYFIDGDRPYVRRISADGMIDAYVNPGPSSPDGTPRESVGLPYISRIEIDGEGRIYWYEGNNYRRIGNDGLLETVWSLPESSNIFHVSADATLYFVSYHRVEKVLEDGTQTAVAGIGAASPRGDGGAATEATFGSVAGLSAGPNGALYIVDGSLLRVRVVRDGRIESFAGNGRGPAAGEAGSGDGGPALEAPFRSLFDVAAAPDGTVYIAEGEVVRRVDPEGNLSTYAGRRGFTCDRRSTFPSINCGDGGPAIDAALGTIQELEVDDQGNLYVFHREIGSGYLGVRKITPDGVINSVPDRLPDGGRVTSVFAIALDQEQQLLISRFGGSDYYLRLGHEGEYSPIEGPNGFVSWAYHMAMDSAGSLYVNDESGRITRITSEGVVNELIPPPLGPPSGDGGPPDQAVLGGIYDLVVDDEDNLYIADFGRVRRISNVKACPVVVRPQVALGGVRNAAAGSILAPGTIFSIYGIRLGPEPPVGGIIEGGRFTTELNGLRVLIDGAPAPLLYASSTQVNAVVPFGTEVDGTIVENSSGNQFLQNHWPELEVEYQGVVSYKKQLTMWPAGPGIFSYEGRAAAFNQDGSLNSPLNPASPGSVLVFFATGAGLLTPTPQDGAIVEGVLPAPTQPVEVTVGGEPAEVLYAGAAPGFVAGLLQVNVRISPTQQGLGAVPLTLKIGGFNGSQSVIVGR